MKHKFVRRTDATRLILIYAGWGMDWRPFADLDRPGYDIMVVWDYRELTFNWAPLMRYDEICLIAWSMGVFAASVTIHEIAPRITMRIAINGTLYPIDEARGIPPAIWNGTLNALSPATWRKFQRRMCDSAEQFARFSENAPKRTIADLAEELEALSMHTMFHVEQITDWDMAVVSRHDGIFPAVNQSRAWQNVAPVRILDAGHLPDFKQILHRLIIDKEKVGARFSRAAATYTDAARVQQRIAANLFRRFNIIFGPGPIVGNIIEVGPGTDCTLTSMWYQRTDPRARLRIWDLADIPADRYAPAITFEQCDAEVRMKRQPSDSAGFIFSSSTIQWFNSPREFIKECRRVLVPGGYLVLSSFVQGNLEELTSVTGNGLQLPTFAGWQRMIPQGMELLVCEPGLERLDFDNPRMVLEHLRDTGVNGVSYADGPVVTARRILRDYPVDKRTGKYTVTYRPIYIIARRSLE